MGNCPLKRGSVAHSDPSQGINRGSDEKQPQGSAVNPTTGSTVPQTPHTVMPDTTVPAPIEQDSPDPDASEPDVREQGPLETDAPEPDAPEPVAPEPDVPEQDAPEPVAPEPDASTPDSGPTTPPEGQLDDASRDRTVYPATTNELEPSSLSTKWVSTSSEPSEQGAVVVHPDSNTVIDSFPSRPLNFVTIFGPARSGKSFVMNALARRNGVFRVSPAAASCTSGVDLSKTVVSLEEFTGGAAKGKYEDMPHIGFVDVEGLGDKDPSHHVKLAIPPMLVSKVILFNLKDVQRTTLLDTLAVLQRAANAVARAESQEVYGHLIILVRDTYDKADDINRLVFDVEVPHEDVEHEEVTAMELRNLHREKLNKTFQDVKVWCLPQPHSDINENKSFGLSDLKPEFHAKLDGLRQYMGEVLSNPHKFGGRNIAGGTMLQPLMKTLCAAVSDSKTVKPISIMESIEVQEAELSCNNGVENFDAILGSFDSVDVWSTEMMERKLRDARDMVFAEFDDATKDLIERVKEVAKKRLQERIDRQAAAFRTAMEIDRMKMDESVRLLNEEAFVQVENEASCIQMPIDDFAAVWDKLCDNAFSDLQALVDDKMEDGELLPYVSAVLNRAEFKQATQEKYKRFDQRNNLEEQVKHAKIDREEADEVMKQILAGEAQQRDTLERKMKSQAIDHSKHLEQLENSLRRVANEASEMSEFLEEREQQHKIYQEEQRKLREQQQRQQQEQEARNKQQQEEQLRQLRLQDQQLQDQEQRQRRQEEQLQKLREQQQQDQRRQKQEQEQQLEALRKQHEEQIRILREQEQEKDKQQRQQRQMQQILPFDGGGYGNAAECHFGGGQVAGRGGGGGNRAPLIWNAFQHENKGKFTRKEMQAAYWNQ